MLVKFWGVRGSVPVPSPTTIKYGGNTACIEVRCGKDIIIIDGGTAHGKKVLNWQKLPV